MMLNKICNKKPVASPKIQRKWKQFNKKIK